jgi:orotidine-5'-phosphate decarboxylase
MASSIVIACDQSLKDFRVLLDSIQDLSYVSAFKVGAALGLEIGLKNIVQLIKSETGKQVIYDHQKAGTDVPHTGDRFMDVMKEAKIDSVILFPQAGPKTFRAWVKAAKQRELNVIAGGLMTHQGYVASDGGYIQDNSIVDIYAMAASMGVTDIVVPGNRPKQAHTICNIYESVAYNRPNLYIPGYQYSQIVDPIPSTEYDFHLIIGRKIFKSKDPNIELARWGTRLGLMCH